MNGLFYRCEGLKSINISSFDMKKVDEISYMFREIKLEYLDISNLDTSNVKDMSGLFYGATNL